MFKFSTNIEKRKKKTQTVFGIIIVFSFRELIVHIRNII